MNTNIIWFFLGVSVFQSFSLVYLISGYPKWYGFSILMLLVMISSIVILLFSLRKNNRQLRLESKQNDCMKERADLLKEENDTLALELGAYKTLIEELTNEGRLIYKKGEHGGEDQLYLIPLDRLEYDSNDKKLN